MGCSGSSGKQKVEVPAERRRLSVGIVENEEATEEIDVREEDRGLLSALDNETVLQLLEGKNIKAGRRMSIGTALDAGKEAFANKAIQQLGDAIEPAAAHLGYTCRKGLKPESPNQDSWFCLKVEQYFSLYAVFDGHGSKGHKVSQFVKDNLPKLILMDERFGKGSAQLPDMLKENFQKIQDLIIASDKMGKLNASLSGTTATLVVHEHESKEITVAHVADSSSVLGRRKGTGDFEAEQLTRDHKPNLKDEKARIEKAGGMVVFDGYANHRIYARNARHPGLNMSRCLGDLLGHQSCGISAVPEVSQRKLDPEDEILLLCSDGVWEFVAPLEAVKLVGGYGPEEAMEAANALAKESWDRWIEEEGGAVVDDITVVLVYLK